ncbi:MAG TPA: CDP-alcohol phosphatidyltransferase family protein, partial [Gemmatimonadales bacterium]|nr:CDP-alcohol phosphatidyltransferase family protein [Gemmatimonadales bacterium]
MITSFGIVLIVISAVYYGLGHIRLGGFFLLLSGWTDMIDGQVARGGGMETKFGAFYDSTLDRIGDGLTYIGLGSFYLLY